MKQFLSLVTKLQQGIITAGEVDELEQLLREAGDEDAAIRHFFLKHYSHDEEAHVPNPYARRVKERLLDHIAEEQASVKPLHRKWMVWAAAASIIAIIVWTSWLHISPQKNEGRAAEQIATVQPAFKEITNNSAIDTLLLLPDRSTVVLAPGSSLIYTAQMLTSNARDIRLRGKATFKVFKDKTRPFTVFAAHIAVKALGTEFVVDAKTPGTVVVRLWEGRVKVWPTNTGLQHTDSIYMRPGEVLKLNADEVCSSAKKPLIRDSIISTQQNRAQQAGALVFHNEPLDRVFETLGKKYHRSISFDKKAMQGLLFTGTIQPADPLHTVLHFITKMNGLCFKETGQHILIQKQP